MVDQAVDSDHDGTIAVRCWDEDILKTKKPGPVAIAKTGSWDELEINLTAPSNHAKIGTAIADGKKYAVFGDMNQQGALSPPGCDKSQNGRGGLFFAVQDDKLFESEGIDRRRHRLDQEAPK